MEEYAPGDLDSDKPFLRAEPQWLKSKSKELFVLRLLRGEREGQNQTFRALRRRGSVPPVLAAPLDMLQ